MFSQYLKLRKDPESQIVFKYLKFLPLDSSKVSDGLTIFFPKTEI